jgi:hypothetical protein
VSNGKIAPYNPLSHKEVRAGRKVGHLNLTDSDPARLTAALNALVPLLPPTGEGADRARMRDSALQDVQVSVKRKDRTV